MAMSVCLSMILCVSLNAVQSPPSDQGVVIS